MKHALMFILLTLSACTFDFPVTTEQEYPVQNQLLGLWDWIPDSGAGDATSVMVLRHSDNEYAVHYFADDGALYFRAWEIEVGNLRIFQLELIGDEKGSHDDAGNRWHLSRVTVDGCRMTLSHINTDLVPGHLESSEQILQALVEHQANEDLFDDADRFVRSAEQPGKTDCEDEAA